jgi:hypothetical protein
MHLHSSFISHHPPSFRFQKQHNLGEMGELDVSNRPLGGFPVKANVEISTRLFLYR